MAADSVTTTITNAQATYPDITSTNGIVYANRIHRDLLQSYPEMRMDTEDTNLTAGTYEYALDEDIWKVWSAVYLTAASTGTSLFNTTPVQLDNLNPDWRLESNVAPTKFYIASNTTGRVLGLFGKPPTTTTGGYPIVRMYVSRRGTTLSGSDLVYDWIPSSRVYSAGIAYYHALARYPEHVPIRLEDYQRELSRVDDFVRGTMLQQRDQSFPQGTQKDRG